MAMTCSPVRTASPVTVASASAVRTVRRTSSPRAASAPSCWPARSSKWCEGHSTSSPRCSRVQAAPRWEWSAPRSEGGVGVVRVPPDFAEEFPDGDPTAAEVVATLIRAGQSLYDELDRGMQASFGVPETVLQCLAVIDGAEGPLTPSDI